MEGLGQCWLSSAPLTSATNGLSESSVPTDFSALFELSITARFRVSQYLWLRAAYQFYAVTGLALGPRQLSGADHNGVVGLDGFSLGLETAW